jgi:hypothetical protein
VLFETELGMGVEVVSDVSERRLQCFDGFAEKLW